MGAIHIYKPSPKAQRVGLFMFIIGVTTLDNIYVYIYSYIQLQLHSYTMYTYVHQLQYWSKHLKLWSPKKQLGN